MYRLLRISICTSLLLSGLILLAQEPATIDSEPAVRFQQSPGYYHYVAFCRTPKAASPQMPKTGLPVDQIEFGLGWYVKASISRGAGGPSPEIEGRIVVSQHHVRFMPGSPQLAEQYVDLSRDEVEMAHSPGQAEGKLRAKDTVVNFQFRKICLSCAAGAPIPAGVNAALVDQEFALLGETLTKFESGWRKSYRMSKGDRVDPDSGTQPASVASSPRAPAALSTGTSTAANSEVADASTASTPHALRTSTITSSGTVVRTSAPATMVVPRKPVKIGSGAADGLLVKKIPPAYPLEAKLVRLEGTVVLHAVIDRTGEVAEVNALSGPPLLESAAVDAVKQWQYRPYSMNGQLVDVETTIDVVFALDGHPSLRVQSARR